MYHTIRNFEKAKAAPSNPAVPGSMTTRIDTITGRFHNGDMVTVHDFDGYPWEMVSSTRIPRSASA